RIVPRELLGARGAIFVSWDWRTLATDGAYDDAGPDSLCDPDLQDGSPLVGVDRVRTLQSRACGDPFRIPDLRPSSVASLAAHWSDRLAPLFATIFGRPLCAGESRRPRPSGDPSRSFLGPSRRGVGASSGHFVDHSVYSGQHGRKLESDRRLSRARPCPDVGSGRPVQPFPLRVPSPVRG